MWHTALQCAAHFDIRRDMLPAPHCLYYFASAGRDSLSPRFWTALHRLRQFAACFSVLAQLSYMGQMFAALCSSLKVQPKSHGGSEYVTRYVY